MSSKWIDRHVAPLVIDAEWAELQRQHRRRWISWVWIGLILLLCAGFIVLAVHYGPKNSMYHEMVN